MLLSIWMKPKHQRRTSFSHASSVARSKLSTLTIRFHSVLRNRRPPVLFFQALEACTNVTICTTAVDNDLPEQIHFSQREQLQLQRIATRNVELGRFVSDPSTYPAEQLLTLLRQFNKCPSGLYMLASRFQVVSSFNKFKAQSNDWNFEYAHSATAENAGCPDAERQRRLAGRNQQPSPARVCYVARHDRRNVLGPRNTRELKAAMCYAYTLHCLAYIL